MNPEAFQAAAGAFRLFGNPLLMPAPAFRAAREMAARVVLYRTGFIAGYELRPRDWEMPDDWHRGYLAGRFAVMKARRRHAQ